AKAPVRVPRLIARPVDALVAVAPVALMNETLVAPIEHRVARCVGPDQPREQPQEPRRKRHRIVESIERRDHLEERRSVGLREPAHGSNIREMPYCLKYHEASPSVHLDGRETDMISRLLVVAAVAAAALTLGASTGSAVSLPPGNTAQQWDKIAEDTVVGSGAFQGESFVYLAYVSKAMDRAVNPGQRNGQSADAAVAQAAYDVLVHYFPSQAANLSALRDA